MSKSPNPMLESHHSNLTVGADINWEDIRIFLKVAEVRSFRTAAAQTGYSPKVVTARINALEHQIGAVLFNRDARGAELTTAGTVVRERANLMLASAQSLRALCDRRQPIRRTVKVGCTEGIGTFWLLPRLIELSESYPGIHVQLDCETRPRNVKTLDVDIAVQLDRPEVDPDLKIVRLCSVHVVLFAAQRYIEKHGKPERRADLVDHNVLEIAGAQIRSEALELDKLGRDPREFVNLSLNTASAQLVAAKHGAGITAMPTFTVTLTDGLVHVAEDWALRRDVWLVFHRQAAELPHVRKTIDWIKQAFDPNRYPWFRDSFVKPGEIATITRDRETRAVREGYDQYA
ncbi:LysR family transcriptional regulator [Bosea sp. BK604]|uniref:LysR family transcriptional regulator n=1 Tax=Bosea sp. BK604 TaxID=2512180 RepID=UPI001053E602|nr:LysR family transcriptional regulator [Bosea sp. BK604]TCR68351.1 LysR family transcriptional regulator [Bosea sp. BK604]